MYLPAGYYFDRAYFVRSRCGKRRAYWPPTFGSHLGRYEPPYTRRHTTERQAHPCWQGKR